MAIQISGTTVINNSRFLENVIGIQESVVTINATTTTTTVNLNLGSVFYINLQSNTTLTFSNPPTNNIYRQVLIHIKRDANANRTLAITNARYTDGVAPAYTTVAQSLDVISAYTINGGTTYNVAFVMADIK